MPNVSGTAASCKSLPAQGYPAVQVTSAHSVRWLGPPHPSLSFLRMPVSIFMLLQDKNFLSNAQERPSSHISAHQPSPFPQNVPSPLSPSHVSAKMFRSCLLESEAEGTLRKACLTPLSLMSLILFFSCFSISNYRSAH